MKNPVVLATHHHRLDDGHSPVVGSVIKAWIDGQGLWVVIEFVEGTELGDEYWLLYSRKKQRALSVGFVPHEGEWREVKQKRIWVHTRVELLEISCVPVPANPAALTRSRQRKADFVAAKKQGREDERMLAEIRAEYPDWDRRVEEFGEALLTWSDEKIFGSERSDADDDPDKYARIITGKATGFAALFK